MVVQAIIYTDWQSLESTYSKFKYFCIDGWNDLVSSAYGEAILIYLIAVVPYFALFAPWSHIKRFIFCVSLVVCWFAWSGSYLKWVVPLSTFAVFGILWLHGYRIYRDRSTANAHSVVQAGAD